MTTLLSPYLHTILRITRKPHSYTPALKSAYGSWVETVKKEPYGGSMAEGEGEGKDGEEKKGNEVRYADVGINLTDPTYQGFYNHHTTPSHPPDLPSVISRATTAGVRKLIVTGSDLQNSLQAIELAKQYPGQCYATVGVHPCSSQIFETYEGGGEKLLEELEKVAREGIKGGWVVAFGEIGVDFDRLGFAGKEVQERWFAKQLEVAVKLPLPLFLHSRSAHPTFLTHLLPFLPHLPSPHPGLVHSFTGTPTELTTLLHHGFHIGINGCSLKTPQNLSVVAQIPLSRLQLETDGPWCEIRGTSAGWGVLAELEKQKQGEKKGLDDGGWKKFKKEKWQPDAMVKGRNEPAEIVKVARVVAGVKGISVEEVMEAAWRNSVGMFGLGVKG
ncbi:MAG: hypothetical protein Q9178_002401 [Gyalolechia marmorata]